MVTLCLQAWQDMRLLLVFLSEVAPKDQVAFHSIDM